jgi:hypothetical protein
MFVYLMIEKNTMHHKLALYIICNFALKNSTKF